MTTDTATPTATPEAIAASVAAVQRFTHAASVAASTACVERMATDRAAAVAMLADDPDHPAARDAVASAVLATAAHTRAVRHALDALDVARTVTGPEQRPALATASVALAASERARDHAIAARRRVRPLAV